LGLNHQSCSHWYARDTNYKFFVKEDQCIRDYVFQVFRHCIVSKVKIERRERSIRFQVSAANIRPLVGPNGKFLETLRCKILSECQYLRQDYSRYSYYLKAGFGAVEKPTIQVFVRQVVNPEVDSHCLAYFIVLELEKRVPFRRVLRIAQERVKNLRQVNGLRLQISGRLNGIDIARTEWVRKGRIPLHILSASLDYSCKAACTIYGLIGVKVWIFRSISKNFIIVISF
jgi:small subunit ribosomal protein S3